jgi:hypothetical protein
MESFGFFAAWVGVAAFLLAIPMAVVANLLTPRVQAWWATTTNARKDKRINKLKTRLKFLETSMSSIEVRIDCVSTGLAYGMRAACYLAFGLFQLWGVLAGEAFAKPLGPFLDRLFGGNPPISVRISAIVVLVIILGWLGLLIILVYKNVMFAAEYLENASSYFSAKKRQSILQELLALLGEPVDN